MAGLNESPVLAGPDRDLFAEHRQDQLLR
jgi:hypothetical protein